MKNNKGFTLVEVLAVVAILITIIAIITPKIFKQFKTAENITDQEQINSLINTAKLYMNQNTNLLPEENDLYVISLSELKESGLINTSQILNPSTKQELTGCILVQYENNKYKYEYETDNETCNQVTITFDPQGGTLQQTTKNVIIGHNYGELPIPTKEGYTFMGWVLNLFDAETTLDGYEFNITNIQAKNSWYVSDYIAVESGQIYYIIGKNNGSRVNYYDEQKNNVYTDSSGTSAQIQITNEAIKYIRFNGLISEKEMFIFYSGFVSNITQVTQEQNHTLKAIWKANE